MSRRRASVWALVALAVAAAPGAATFVPSHRDLDRAPVVADRPAPDPAPAVAAPSPVVDVAPLAAPALDGATGIAAPAPAPDAPAPAPELVPAAAPTEVPIVPPAELTGAVAPAAPPPVLYQRARAAPDAPGEVYSLSIGIDDYPGDDHDLDAAVADATTIDTALAGFGVPAEHRVVLRDGQARRDQVVSAVRALVDRAGPGSTLVFAFAGHVRKVDADTEAMLTVEGATITDQELADLLAPVRAERVWLLLATCYAGGFTEALAPGRILTGAAGADSLAYESPSLGASLLVHHLVREGWLEGRAGPSVQEAFAYADQRLSARPERRPVQIDHTDGPLVLGAANPVRHPDPPPPPPTSTKADCLLGIICRPR